MPQIKPSIGRMPARHASHTGKREILTSGSEQIRQLDGKRTVNKPSAAVPNKETNEDCRSEDSALEARVSSPLLLKTPLPRPDQLVALLWTSTSLSITA